MYGRTMNKHQAITTTASATLFSYALHFTDVDTIAGFVLLLVQIWISRWLFGVSLNMGSGPKR